MGKGGKKTTKRKKTTSVKGLPVKDTKAIKVGGQSGGGGAGKANLQDLTFTKYGP
jgi:hypothetical protein